MRTWATMGVGAAGSIAVASLAAACSSMDASEASGADGVPSAEGGGSTTWTTTSIAAGGSGGYVPPEEELESTFGAPVSTGKYVWTANPTSGRVAYINAETLQIEVVEAGNAPTYLAAIPDPDDDVAIVLNVLSRDATVLRAAADGTLSSFTLPVPPAGNAWTVSDDGRWATAWTDARGVAEPDPLDGYQDIAVLDLAREEPSATALTVGYRPMALGYDAAASRLFAITADGISVVDLTADAPALVGNVALSDDPLEDPSTRDVSITPDGSFALVRREGESFVSVFSLTDDSRTDVALAGVVTDLDLAADGSVAVAVIREAGQVALLPLPEVATAPEAVQSFTVEGTVIGSVALAAEASTAILYTNALPSEVLTVFDADDAVPDPRTILLHAPVQSVFPTADGAHAIVLHHELDPASSYPAALSVVPIAATLPSKIVGLDASPVSVAIAPDGGHALVATGSAQEPAYRLVVSHMPSLQIDSYELASRPIAAGIAAAANQGYVAQEHPDGRITFVNFATGHVRTLTGFELASQVVDGSKP